MSEYGDMYRIPGIIGRMIPKKGDINKEHLLSVLSFMGQLERVQNKNPVITIPVQGIDGWSVYINGENQGVFRPFQNYIALAIYSKNDFYSSICTEAKKGKLFKIRATGNYAGKWKIEEPEFTWVLEYLNNKKMEPTPRPCLKPNQHTSSTHSRHIPGHIRQLILEEFISKGRWCLGVSGKTKKHRLLNERIEFDHILPVTKGGSNQLSNIQILCKQCNRLKRDTAL